MSVGCLPRHVYAGYLLPGTAGLALGAAPRAGSQCGPMWQVILNMAGWEGGGVRGVATSCVIYNLSRRNVVSVLERKYVNDTERESL